MYDSGVYQGKICPLVAVPPQADPEPTSTGRWITGTSADSLASGRTSRVRVSSRAQALKLFYILNIDLLYLCVATSIFVFNHSSSTGGLSFFQCLHIMSFATNRDNTSPL